jgi:hypothetical protein
MEAVHGYTIQRAYPADFEQVWELFEKFDNSKRTKQDRQKLFVNYWGSPEDYVGVLIKDGDKLITYLGLLFSKRVINGVPRVFCNLSSFIIDTNYRGQKLTHRAIEFVLQQGEYTVTAITPIPQLYSMYAKNGFKNLSDYRMLFRNYPFLAGNSKASILTNVHEIATRLSGEDKKICNDHATFNCVHVLFSEGGKNTYLILKARTAQRRKLLDNRFLNYADLALRKLGFRGFMSTQVTYHEVMYCSNYEHLCSQMQAFCGLYFKQYRITGVAVNMEQYERYKPSYAVSNRFYHSRQMYYSKNVAPYEYDTLYSELFVLDM